MKAAPILKPKAKEKTSLIELPEDSGAIYQAIGILPGEVSFEDKKASVTVEGKTYPLYSVRTKRDALYALKLHVAAQGAFQRLIVYPKFKHFPGRDTPYKVYFQVVGFAGDNGNSAVTSALSDFEFKLSGLWQFIAPCKTPVVSIYKNFTNDRLTFVKEADVVTKVNFLKASHVPLFWRDALVPPFRFNPKLDKEKQGHPAFVQITARFSTSRDAFEFSALQSLPASNAPKCLKAGKEEKAKAIAERSKASNLTGDRPGRVTAHPLKSPAG